MTRKVLVIPEAVWAHGLVECILHCILQYCLAYRLPLGTMRFHLFVYRADLNLRLSIPIVLFYQVPVVPFIVVVHAMLRLESLVFLKY